ncbi:MAG: sigma-70 family RNA polymerase sigma factor [Deltaproteobacteria bacterium]|nr:sigma-70 family RNA polymerase sigma factor [Deltaproteobacteria bacterium]
MSAEPADLDYALLRRMARGDEAALAELIRRHERPLYHLAYRLLKDPLEAEDVLQEVFLKAYEHAGRYRPTGTVRGWLNRITANHCLNRLRGRNPADPLDEAAGQTPGPDPTPLEALTAKELHARLEHLLAGLPENQRRALVMKQFGGMSYQEIGELLGVSPQAVDGLIKRARQTLRRALQDEL